MKILVFTCLAILALFAFDNKANAAMCGQGVTCFNATFALNNSNDPSTTPVSIYTAPPSGNGAKITAIFIRTVGVSACAPIVLAYINHSATNYLLGQAAFQDLGVAYNILTASTTAGVGILNAWSAMPTDENGNPFIFLSAGDSISITLSTGVPPSGACSGSYPIQIMGQSY